MISRMILGKEWKSLNDAFYDKPKKGLLRGSYWCWLLQGRGNSPKIWLMVTHIAAKHTINGVESHATETDGKSFGTMTTCWYYDRGKMHDLFIEKSTTTIRGKKMTSRTDSGYVLELSNDIPNYRLVLKKGDKTIMTCKSRKADFSKCDPVRYEDSLNTKSFLDKRNKAYWLLSESIRIPQIVKYTNMFTFADVRFKGRKFTALSYTEKNHNIGPAMPWKYAIFDLKDGSRFRFFWSFKSFLKSPSDLDMTFDCVKTGKKYFFNDTSKLNYHYLDGKGRRSDVFGKSTKSLVIRSVDENGAKIDIVADVIGSHTYEYRIGIGMVYVQILRRLKKIEITDGGRKIRIDPKGSYGYGEYVNFIR